MRCREILSELTVKIAYSVMKPCLLPANIQSKARHRATALSTMGNTARKRISHNSTMSTLPSSNPQHEELTNLLRKVTTLDYVFFREYEARTFDARVRVSHHFTGVDETHVRAEAVSPRLE